MSSKQRNILLVFDILNVQSNYAECMELISALETKQGLSAYLNESKARFFVNRLRYLQLGDEQLPKPGGTDYLVREFEREFPNMKVAIIERFIQSVLNKDYDYHFYYYFRVNSSDNTDVAEFIYYVLMLQDPSIPVSRIITYLVACPELYKTNRKTNDNNSNYFRFSHFTMLLPEQYHHCFSTYTGKDGTDIVRLTKNGITNSFVPLIEISEHARQGLIRKWKITFDDTLGSRTPIEKWMMTFRASGCKDRITKQLFSFSNFCIGQSLSTIDLKNEEKNYVLKAISGAADKINGFTSLEYIVFGILLNEYHEMILQKSEWVSLCLRETLKLSSAILQLLENTVFHSANHKGLFAIRVHKSAEQTAYLEKEFEGFLTDNRSRSMQLLIADTNRENNIIDTFLMNPAKSTPQLRQARDILTLSDFMGDYALGPARKIWERAIDQELVHCAGLKIFANAMRELNAVTFVRSSTRYSDDSPSTRWCRNFRNDHGHQTVYANESVSCIPGTQFISLLPLSVSKTQKQHESTIIREMATILSESFEAYSRCLDYEAEEIETKDLLEIGEKFHKQRSPYDLQKKKDDMVVSFLNAFNSKNYSHDEKKSYIYIANMLDICRYVQDEWLEPLCKGLLSSHFVRTKEQCYLMLLNCSEDFSNCFYNAVKADPLTLARKDLQICLYREDGSNYPILGENIDIVRRSIYAHEKKIDPRLINYKPSIPNGRYPKNSKSLPWIFPFDMYSLPGEMSVFEKTLAKFALSKLAPEASDETAFGFCLDETHMRLGNKVHIDTFYELAPYFVRQNVAKQTAFCLLKRLLAKESFVDLLKKNGEICFYGYASYSRTIVSSMVIILNQYIVEKNKQHKKMNMPLLYQARLSFAIFQTRQAGEASDTDEQIYYSGILTDNDAQNNFDSPNIDFKKSIIQIVPISTTLTTFKKMRAKAIKKIPGMSDKPAFNLTIFWVRDSKMQSDGGPSQVEMAYWDHLHPDEKIIITKDEIIQEPMYVQYQKSIWRDPISCEKCFPVNSIMEYPLIETDDSSTIPSQQFYRRGVEENSGRIDRHCAIANETRVAKLQRYVKYGHITSGPNHFQYFIDTQNYFLSQKNFVRKWLVSLSYKSDVIACKHKVVIVSPQKPNNVEFSQYVNNFYFNGNAEFICLDSEKHFRSNVEAEYYDYTQKISKNVGFISEVKYVYVDISILTGITYQRICSLMNSITGLKEAFTFDKIFVLVNRMSIKSQTAYVKDPEKNFHAFVHLNVSNLRTYGDSCICCNLRYEAERFYRLAATKSISEYWEEKIYKNSEIQQEHWGKIFNVKGKPIDSLNRRSSELRKKQQSKGYLRLICTHIAAKALQPVRGSDFAKYFDIIKGLFDNAIKIDRIIRINENIDAARVAGKNNFNKDLIFRHMDYGQIFDDHQKENLFVKTFIKVLARPFFSFDYKMRCCISDLIMVLIVFILYDCRDIEKARILLAIDNRSSKKYLLCSQNLEWLLCLYKSISKAFKDNNSSRNFLLILLKGLTDLHSNFVLRKSTLIGINQYLSAQGTGQKDYEDFLSHYIRYILNVAHSGSDERNGLWLEYLLINHSEFNENEKPQPKTLYEDFELINLPKENRHLFENFYNTLLVENGQVIYSGVKNAYQHIQNLMESDYLSGDKTRDQLEKLKHDQFFKESFLWDFCRFVLVDEENELVKNAYEIFEEKYVHKIQPLIALMHILSDTNGDHNGTRYKKLQTTLSRIVVSHYDITVGKFGKEADKCVTLLAKQERGKDKPPEYLPLDPYFRIVPIQGFEQNIPVIPPEAEEEMDHHSFFVSDGLVIIKLDNNYQRLMEIKNRGATFLIPRLQKIEPVYIHIQLKECAKNIKSLLLVRKILLFRNQFINWLEKDFSNDTLPTISKIRNSAKLLSTDKAGHHSDTSDTDALQVRLMRAPFPDRAFHIDNTKDKRLYRDMELRFGDHKGTCDWLLLQDYVNTKIARLYRSMVYSETLDDEDNVDYSTLYRDEYTAISNKAKLNNLGESIYDYVTSQEIIDGYDILGQTRRRYFEVMLKAIVFVFGKNKDGTDITSDKIDDVISILRSFNCIELTIQNEIFGYCSEQIVCLILDYCFSAVKYGIHWNNPLFKDSGGKYRYLSTSEKKDRCHIYISRRTGDTYGGVEYDYLVLENQRPAQSKDNESKPFGMSILSTKWYIDTLWKQYAKHKELDLSKSPRVITDSHEVNRFALELPILRRQGG